MTTTSNAMRSVTVERQLAHPPEKVWRALTQPHLIAEWLMQTDFQPEIGRNFQLSGEWGAVDCQVKEIEPHKTLSYSWNAMGLESVVTWTLTPQGTGTHLRMEQAGFRPDQEQYFQGAQYAWPDYFTALVKLLAHSE